MRQRIYSQAERKRKTKYHKKYNKTYDYGTNETRHKKYTWAEMYLIWNKRVKGGRILTDIQIARLLKRSLQAIQLKRYKMKMEGQ